MEHRTLNQIAEIAEVVPLAPQDARARRRQRLDRLATLLEQHKGPIRLLSQIEHMPRDTRLTQRADNSPLTIAYCDTVLRVQGLESDRLGDAMAFFDLSFREAHELFCDCHYGLPLSSGMVAARTRALSRKQSWGELWGKFRGAVLGR